jgi:phosphopantothenoylcysteine decarboxylase/phosphopantothenate--cysteine ligase
MDLDMYTHSSVQTNLQSFAEKAGHSIIEPNEGPLASGLIGKGRMAEPEEITQVLIEHFCPSASAWSGKTILITAGPTHEAIDPVRFIGNRSSGRMGIELSKALANQGASVHLVLGPTHLEVPHWIQTHRVESAAEMHAACLKYQSECDWIFMAAAVADYRPVQAANQKIKKSEKDWTLDLIPNADILRDLSSNRPEGQRVIGFALETQEAETYGKSKLQTKGLDAIVINETGPHSGFGTQTNQVLILGAQGQRHETKTAEKSRIAQTIIDTLEEWFYA